MFHITRHGDGATRGRGEIRYAGFVMAESLLRKWGGRPRPLADAFVGIEAGPGGLVRLWQAAPPLSLAASPHLRVVAALSGPFRMSAMRSITRRCAPV